jgi:hypothetical protein
MQKFKACSLSEFFWLNKGSKNYKIKSKIELIGQVKLIITSIWFFSNLSKKRFLRIPKFKVPKLGRLKTSLKHIWLSFIVLAFKKNFPTLDEAPHINTIQYPNDILIEQKLNFSLPL